MGVDTHRYAHDGLYGSRWNQALAEEGEEGSEDKVRACIYYEIPLHQVDATTIATTSTTTDIISAGQGICRPEELCCVSFQT